MPVIKSAKKKLRQDKKRTARNKNIRELLRDVLKKARKNPSEKTIQAAIKTTDKAAKAHIIHKNKAARLKSSLSKLFGKKANPVSKSKSIKKTKKLL